MQQSVILTLLCSLFVPTANSYTTMTSSCGIDNSPMTVVYEGWSKIEYYPWMGYLIYPKRQKRFTTAVVLVSRQIVIASANEIHKLPKHDFRRRSRVILGQNCSGPPIRVQEYVYHPEFLRGSSSELTIIQLDIDYSTQDLRPVCPPPTHMINPEFYAMSFGHDCTNSRIRIHKMSHVDIQDCRRYYRKAGLDMLSLWPRHTVCAAALDRRSCVWRSGTVLVMKQGERWLLMGFGVYGPGCSEPARFVDYGMYHSWVKTSIARIGRPAVTKVNDAEVILRRSLNNVQRFGACDPEEAETEIYTDLTNVSIALEDAGSYKLMRYNVSLLSNVDYSCVVFRIINQHSYTVPMPPKLNLRRWCAGPREMCHDFQFLQIDFFVEIFFAYTSIFKMNAYGKPADIIDPRRAMERANNWSRTYPPIARESFTKYFDADNKWFPFTTSPSSIFRWHPFANSREYVGIWLLICQR